MSSGLFVGAMKFTHAVLRIRIPVVVAARNTMMSPKWSFGWVLAVWLQAPCIAQIAIPLPGTAPSVTPSQVPAALSTTTSAETARSVDPVVSPGYLLQPGDVLQISVWKETELTNETTIRPDGGFSFPLAGEFAAAGRTVAQLTVELERRLRKYEPDAVVTVGVKAAAGNRVYVIGKVVKPGDFPLNRPTDVMQALSLAGGATPFANTNAILILRRAGAKETSIRFRYKDVRRGRKLDQNILLQSGDTVVVP